MECKNKCFECNYCIKERVYRYCCNFICGLVDKPIAISMDEDTFKYRSETPNWCGLEINKDVEETKNQEPKQEATTPKGETNGTRVRFHPIYGTPYIPKDEQEEKAQEITKIQLPQPQQQPPIANPMARETPSSLARKHMEKEREELRQTVRQMYTPSTANKTEEKPTPFNKFAEQMRLKADWKDVLPKVDFANVKKDEFYHVPPIKNDKRKDIQIVYASPTYLSYKVLGENNNITYTLFKNDLIAKVMVKTRTKEFKPIASAVRAY